MQSLYLQVTVSLQEQHLYEDFLILSQDIDLDTDMIQRNIPDHSGQPSNNPDQPIEPSQPPLHQNEPVIDPDQFPINVDELPSHLNQPSIHPEQPPPGHQLLQNEQPPSDNTDINIQVI